ncbi:MAG: phosphate acetyltransferase, partial [Lachnospiraceae bacterium]|nr:phosphate acetyltransferase [Lachnospiraceae bacterium]
MAFIDGIKDKARADVKRIVLPESKDRRTLIAAAHIIEEGLADVIMVGNEEKIMDGAGWLEINLDGVKVVDPETDPKFEEYAQLLCELRKKKGMTI